ncbi:Aldehyde dehydrogenase family 7 member A1 [Gossypium arboreum]|uniref:Aldehyde dehydrogenase family 7 member A1 n=1 Tax=Gossypium arboreum TaxID=29729 RepID=A0A0B0NZX8_GOSAR|nr:Aldehyde dehydrogenase family 7 member A1 [Gossypium arboreum]
MPKNAQKWPFSNWTQLGLGRDMLVFDYFRPCSSLLEWNGCVLYPCESCFDSTRLTRPCGLPV